MLRPALLIALAVLGGIASDTASPSAAARRVTVLDGSLRPETLRVPVGATVEFLNRGRKAHRIVAERNLWPPIALRPGARASVRLLAPGRYPYKVDGRRAGLIVAGTPVAGFRPRAGSTLTRIEHRYAVRVEALLRERTTYANGDGRRDGTRTAELTWTSRVPALVLRVELVGADATLSQRAPARGTFTGRLAFSDTRPAEGPCAGDVDYAGLVSDVLLQGSRQRGRASVSFDAGLTPSAGEAYDATRDAAVAAAGCSTFPDAEWLDETVPVDRGVRIHHPPSFSIAAWDTRFSRDGRGTPFPLGAMLAGKSFTVGSGLRSFDLRSCGEGCTESFTGSVKYVFTALPPR